MNNIFLFINDYFLYKKELIYKSAPLFYLISDNILYFNSYNFEDKST